MHLHSIPFKLKITVSGKNWNNGVEKRERK